MTRTKTTRTPPRSSPRARHARRLVSTARLPWPAAVPLAILLDAAWLLRRLLRRAMRRTEAVRRLERIRRLRAAEHALQLAEAWAAAARAEAALARAEGAAAELWRLSGADRRAA